MQRMSTTANQSSLNKTHRLPGALQMPARARTSEILPMSPTSEVKIPNLQGRPRREACVRRLRAIVLMIMAVHELLRLERESRLRIPEYLDGLPRIQCTTTSDTHSESSYTETEGTESSDETLVSISSSDSEDDYPTAPATRGPDPQIHHANWQHGPNPSSQNYPFDEQPNSQSSYGGPGGVGGPSRFQFSFLTEDINNQAAGKVIEAPETTKLVDSVISDALKDLQDELRVKTDYLESFQIQNEELRRKVEIQRDEIEGLKRDKELLRACLDKEKKMVVEVRKQLTQEREKNKKFRWGVRQWLKEWRVEGVRK